MMELTDNEKDSELWKKLTAHFKGLLDKSQRDLEKITLTDVETSAIRGRCKLLRQLLKLGEAKYPLAAPATNNEYR